MTDYELVVGYVDPPRSFERLVDVVARVAGATVREMPGESRSVVGTLAEGNSGLDIFDALVADGYRVILMADGGSIRSSHSSEEDRGDGATDGGSGESPPT
ncbi:hypothetical protein B5D80_03655 [Micromonospora wenchangensis]|uniref:Uncharacterized protein n=1 Tax=Micromonospora wenchangensis TaxID=1185415 RepID=A0A246RSI1_9ACTN|nr:hypothetical protein [Micromonospora wenchangensis]OWV12015.1 hypothetical protein B5D80_03655 [Micromonospora wenchangensis]